MLWSSLVEPTYCVPVPGRSPWQLAPARKKCHDFGVARFARHSVRRSNRGNFCMVGQKCCHDDHPSTVNRGSVQLAKTTIAAKPRYNEPQLCFLGLAGELFQQPVVVSNQPDPVLFWSKCVTHPLCVLTPLFRVFSFCRQHNNICIFGRRAADARGDVFHKISVLSLEVSQPLQKRDKIRTWS